MRRAVLRLLVVALAVAWTLSSCGRSDKSTKPEESDQNPPTRVTDLAVTATDESLITLSWTAPADDGVTSKADRYDMRYGADSSVAWDSMTEGSGEPSPGAAGERDTMRAEGLASSTTYAFRLRSVDPSGNWSEPSNAALGTTAQGIPKPFLVVATKQNGIWYSDDGGSQWHEAAITDYASGFAILVAKPNDPNVIYAGTGLAGSMGERLADIYRSENGGKNWSRLSSTYGFLYCSSIQCLAISPSQPNDLFAGVANYCLEHPCNDCYGQAGAVYRSTDGGNSWDDISAGLPMYPYPQPGVPPFHTSVYAVAVDPGDPQRIYVGIEDLDNGTTNNGFFVSVDGGQSWSPSPLGVADGHIYVDVFTIGIDPSNHLRILACTDEGLYLSEDGGSSWSKRSLGAGRQFIVFDQLQPQLVYTAHERSTDGGVTWSDWPIPAGARAGVQVDPVTGYLYAVGTSGIFRSTNGGTDWSCIRSIYNCTAIVLRPES